MQWLEKIRNKPHKEKVRLIWIAAIVMVIILVGLWVATAEIRKDVPKDTTLFKAVGQGVNDVIENYGK